MTNEVTEMPKKVETRSSTKAMNKLPGKPTKLNYERANTRKGMIVSTIAVPAQDWDRLREIREEEDISISELVRKAIEEWLDRHCPYS
jgi:predicted DNA-binding ribbon-helix-helix protein